MFSTQNKLIRFYATVVDINVLADKTKGCLVGALLGDCLSAPYKSAEEVSKRQLQKYYDQIDGPYFKSPYKPYSCITTLSNGLASSLIKKQTFDPGDVAKSYVQEFYKNPGRNFGENAATIFTQLRGNKFTDIFGPAKNRYLGLGSFGNTSASISAPLALFYSRDPEAMVKYAREHASLLNSNKLGIDGAVLQCFAISNALHFDSRTYLDQLIDTVAQFQAEDEGLQFKDADKLKEQMQLIGKLLLKTNPSEEEVVNTLGHTKLTVYSVPTAIYCFLRSASPVVGIETDNSFRRCLQYATALGGHTTSIASMAGAIAGACYGFESIGKSMQKHCEGLNDVIVIADKLADVVGKLHVESEKG